MSTENLIKLGGNEFILVEYLVNASFKACEVYDMVGKYYSHGV